MERKRPEHKKTNSKNRYADHAKNSRCPISNRCGGCQYIDKSYEEQRIKSAGRMFISITMTGE